MATESPKRKLYARRDLLNAEDFIAHFKAQGFRTTLPADSLHVTVIYSNNAFEWGSDGHIKPWKNLLTCRGGKRTVERLGDEGAIVLRFKSSILAERWEDMGLLGARSDYDSYKPHVTITYDPGNLDISTVKPYTGPLLFGPEIFKEITSSFDPDKLVEKCLAILRK